MRGNRRLSSAAAAGRPRPLPAAAATATAAADERRPRLQSRSLQDQLPLSGWRLPATGDPVAAVASRRCLGIRRGSRRPAAPAAAAAATAARIGADPPRGRDTRIRRRTANHGFRSRRSRWRNESRKTKRTVAVAGQVDAGFDSGSNGSGAGPIQIRLRLENRAQMRKQLPRMPHRDPQPDGVPKVRGDGAGIRRTRPGNHHLQVRQDVRPGDAGGAAEGLLHAQTQNVSEKVLKPQSEALRLATATDRVDRDAKSSHYGLRGLQNETKPLLTDFFSWSQVYHIARLFHLQILSNSNLKPELIYIHHVRKCMKPKLMPL